MIKVKHIDYGYNELGSCESKELRDLVSVKRGEDLAEVISENLDKLVEVAKVFTDNLEDAFRLTNSIEYAWCEDPYCMIDTELKRCRSTSIGDVMVKDDIYYVVDTMGFYKLGKKEDIGA